MINITLKGKPGIKAKVAQRFAIERIATQR
jgi:hypothetical protein